MNPEIPKDGITPEVSVKREFLVEMENPDLIFKAIKDGVSGSLGDTFLEDPIYEVTVDVESNRKTYNLFADIEMCSAVLNRRHYRSDKILKSIAKKYVGNNPGKEYIKRGESLVITTSNGNKFLMGYDTGLFYLNTGLVEGPDKSIQFLPAPEISKEKFDSVMTDFLDIFKRIVKKVYKSEETEMSGEKLVLRPPQEDDYGWECENAMDREMEVRDGLLKKISIEKPQVSFEDIGGQEAAKKEIQGLAFSLKNRELYDKWGTRAPKGIVLYGPPGTGKTMLAKALASQAEAKFFHVQASDIASKWYGESERMINEVFSIAAKSDEKTIIFFDEIDAIAPGRDKAHEATQKVVATILERMDGMSSKDNVMVVASTNRLDGVDSALTRAGRFDRWVEVPLPDINGRKKIFEIHRKKAEVMAKKGLFERVDFDQVNVSIDGFNGADIAEIVRRTLEEKVRQEGTGLIPDMVTTEDVMKEVREYEKIRKGRPRKIGFGT